jgi:hypothetical protein
LRSAVLGSSAGSGEDLAYPIAKYSGANRDRTSSTAMSIFAVHFNVNAVDLPVDNVEGELEAGE